MAHWVVLVLTILAGLWIADLVSHADQLKKNQDLIKKYSEGKFKE
jgi:hypothetical protein